MDQMFKYMGNYFLFGALITPLTVESVFSEWAVITISLVFTFAVNTFELIWAWFAFCSLKSGRISFEICFAALVSYDGKYPINKIISFLFYIITNFLLLNSCYLLL